ncbi:hypothetical protein EJD97_013291 [Solanum chilense]|uniref:Uncharacterized protein n=1 Tax=Solanum chilense TaxID=4083 RepID=A0A6N2CJN5_SOLCI|nr:hypothetical protein EJD97_013291 [Solanum chilense]
MCYTLVGNQWYKKDSLKARVETIRVTKLSLDDASPLLKDMKDVKAHLLTIEDGLKVLQEFAGKLLHLHKDTNIDVGKHHLVVDGEMIGQIVQATSKGEKSQNVSCALYKQRGRLIKHKN